MVVSGVILVPGSRLAQAGDDVKDDLEQEDHDNQGHQHDCVQRGAKQTENDEGGRTP